MNSLFPKLKFHLSHDKKQQQQDESKNTKNIVPNPLNQQDSNSNSKNVKQSTNKTPSVQSNQLTVTNLQQKQTVIQMPSSSSVASEKQRKPSDSSQSNSRIASSKQPQSNSTNNSINKTNTKSSDKENLKKENSSNIFNLIIKNDKKTSSSDEDPPMFDPDPVRDETETFSHTVYLDDRSFMIDDDELDQEVSLINSKARSLHDSSKSDFSNADKTSISSHSSCHVVNEVEEGKISKKGSRGSSRCSNPHSARESANILADNQTGASLNDNESDSQDANASDGCKNELLDTLIRKFNLSVDIEEDVDKPTPFQYANKIKNIMKYTEREDPKRRISDLQKKIHRNQLKQNENEAFGGSIPKLSRSNSDFSKKMKKEIKINRLPQVFVCKYIGKTRCNGLWGVRHTRDPIELLINNAKRLKSIEDLPTMEAAISEKGIYVVQKPSTNTNVKDSKASNERTYRSGLIPIGNVSYGVQDSKYAKVFSCIVVRERDSKTVCECYAFLNNKAEGAKRMALSLTLAFKEYGKLLQIKESNLRHTIMLEDSKNRKKEPHDSMV